MKRKSRLHGENLRYLREIIERLREFDIAEIRLLCERHRRCMISSPSPRPRPHRQRQGSAQKPPAAVRHAKRH